MSCERVENLIRNLFMAFTLMFISGFLILYYAIRKLACASGDLYGLNMMAMSFAVSVLFFSALWYISSGSGSGDHDG